MNTKVVSFLLTNFVLVATVACTDARTTTEAPAPNAPAPIANNSTSNPSASPQNTPMAKADAQSETRAKQLDSDIRAREQRGNAMNDGQNRNDGDLASEVRSKLEANIPGGSLSVASKAGVVTVSGKVTNQSDLD